MSDPWWSGVSSAVVATGGLKQATNVDIARHAEAGRARLDPHRSADDLEWEDEREVGRELEQPAAVQRLEAAGPEGQAGGFAGVIAILDGRAELVELEIELVRPAARVLGNEGLQILLVGRELDD